MDNNNNHRSESARQQLTEEEEDNHQQQQHQQLTMTTSPPILYFAYGAMVNPHSRRLRNVAATDFVPAILPNYHLDFAETGFGNVLPSHHNNISDAASEAVGAAEDGTPEVGYTTEGTGADAAATVGVVGLRQAQEGVHGVFMQIHSDHDWTILKDIEVGYVVVELPVHPYASSSSSSSDKEMGEEHDRVIFARVFRLKEEVPPILPAPQQDQPHRAGRMGEEDDSAAGAAAPQMTAKEEEKKKKNLPSERYLNVIVEGLRHHGVCSLYIARLQSSTECTPRRTPDTYLTFPRRGLRRSGSSIGYVSSSILSDSPDEEDENNDSDDEGNNEDQLSLPEISYDHYVERSKTQPCFLLGSVVLDIVQPPTAPHHPRQDKGSSTSSNGDDYHPMYRMLYDKCIGKADMKAMLLSAIHDPDLPDGDALQDRWAIDLAVEMFQKNGMIDNIRACARVVASGSTAGNEEQQ
jgi:hypothetical protein